MPHFLSPILALFFAMFSFSRSLDALSPAIYSDMHTLDYALMKRLRGGSGKSKSSQVSKPSSAASGKAVEMYDP
jgi:hypothetical protein